MVDTLADDGDKFSGAIDRLEQLITELSPERDRSGRHRRARQRHRLAHRPSDQRPPTAGGTVDQLNRLAPLLDEHKDLIDGALQKAPENYRKLARLGAYGSWINYYLCGISIRVSDLQGRTAVFPWIKQESGRCAEP